MGKEDKKLGKDVASYKPMAPFQTTRDRDGLLPVPVTHSTSHWDVHFLDSM